ncbi:mucin-2-like [Macrobrachium nipponense]|uniref:mucin-2-like n=1 Tax=Macrobrachium nipponense TaxID=159736 RepID=UPI0030C85339
MALGITTVVTSFAILAISFSLQATEAAPKWRPPAVSNRRSSGSALPGCWTPRGRMELGQRVYPGGCSRIVCKIIQGQPVIEHQFCEKIKVPKHCIAQERPWKRYPDCCPEVVCPPTQQSYYGGYDTRLYQQGAAIPNYYHSPSSIQEGFAMGNEGSFHGVASQQHQNPSNINGFFPTPQPLQMATDVVYGKGFSSPYLETSSVRANTDQQLVLIDDNRYPTDFWDPKELHYLVSPNNVLDLWNNDYQEDVAHDGWNADFESGEPYEYREFQDTTTTDPTQATPFVISYVDSAVDDSTKSSYSFYNDANEVKTSPLPYREQIFTAPVVTGHQNVSRTRRPGMIHSKGKQTAKLESTTETTEAPLARPTTYSPHISLRNRYKPTFPVHQVSTQSSFPLSNNPSITKITSLTTEESITTTPTTRTPKTTMKEPTTTSKKDLFLASVKDSKESSHQYEEQPTHHQEDDSDDSEAPSKKFTRLPPVRKTTTTPFERITKRVRPSGAPKKRFRIRKTTTAPTTTATPPSSYEFVSPELDPQDHDLVEFIHTPLDPSALIPGHDGYLQSKYDSTREYSGKESGDEDKRQRRRRSVPADAKHEDEEKDETRTKPIFYIPWRNALESTLSIDAKTLTESQSAENSYPPTKFEQAANILKGLMSHPSLLAGVLTSKKNVAPPTEPLGNKTASSHNFTLNDERTNQSNNHSAEQDTQSTVASKNNTEEDPYDSLTISERKSPPENEENSNTPVENSPENNNLDMGNLTITNGRNSDAQSMVSNNASDPQVTIITFDTVHPSNKPTEKDTGKVNISSPIEKESPAQDDRMATNSSSITQATLSSEAKSDSIQLHNEENQTTELAALVDNGNSNTFNLQFASKNVSMNIQRAVNKRGPNREHNSTMTAIIFATNNSEVNSEDNSPNTRRLPWSPRPSRENQNNGFSSEAVRTRIQVPFLNYERRSKDPTLALPMEPKMITSDSKESSFTTIAQDSKNAEAPNHNQGEGTIHTVKNTNDRTRELSHSRVDMKERKNEYYPRKRTVKDSNIPHLKMVDDSNFSRSMDRSLQLEPTRNFYAESQTYSDWSGDSQNVTGRELSGYPYDIHPKPEPRYRYGLISQSEDNHSLPPFSATISEVPHSFIQSFPSGQGRSFRGRDSKPITSSVTFSNPHVDSILSQYSKSFEDNSDKSNHDFYSETNSESLFPSSGNPQFSSSFGTEHDLGLFDISNHDSSLSNYFKSELNSGTTIKASSGNTETSTVSNPDHTSSEQASESDGNIFELRQTISSLSVPPYPLPTADQSKPHSATTTFSVNPENVPLTLPRSNAGVKYLSATSLQGSIYNEEKPTISPQPEVTSAPPNNTLLNSSSKAPHLPKPINNFRTRLQTPRTQSKSLQSQQTLSNQHLNSSETKNDSLHNNGLPRFSKILPRQPVYPNLTKDSVNGTAKENVENVDSTINSQSSADNSGPPPEQGGQQTQRRLRNRGFANQALRQRTNRRGNSQSRNVPITSPTTQEPTENHRRNSYQTPKPALGSTTLTSNQQRRVSSRQGFKPQSHPLSEHQPTRTLQNQDPRISQKLTANESTSTESQPARTHQNRRFPQQTSINKSNSNDASSYRSRGTHINTNPVSPPRAPVPAPATISPVITKATAPAPTTVPPLRENFSEENINFNPDDASLLYSDFWEPKKNAS